MKVSEMSRRSFLKVSSVVGGGLLLKGFFMPIASGDALAIDPAKNPWFYAELKANGELLLKLARQEMGQSSPSGLAMLFAEELGADWNKVRVTQLEYSKVSKDYYESPLGGTTGGSSAISTLWDPMRKAGAAVREMLIQAASEQWKVDAKECIAREGKVLHEGRGFSIDFFELSEKASRLRVPENPQLKDPNEFTIIGTPKPSAQNRTLSTGSANYSINVKLPNMLYAAVQHCPVFGGKLRSVDKQATLEVPGVRGVYEFAGRPGDETLFRGYGPGVAVVADSTWAAFRGKDALVIDWDEGANRTASYDTLRDRCKRGVFTKTEIKNDFGDIGPAFARGERRHEATFETRFQAHAPMEPLNSTALVEEGRIEVWTSTQNAKGHAEMIASVMDVSLDTVTVNSLVAGGSFGRRVWPDYVIEAVLISKSVGRPVKLTWSREDDIRHDYFHPYERANWKAVLDDTNFISGITNDFGVMGAQNFWWILHWAYLPYGIENVKVTANLLEEPITTGAWRSVTEHLGAFSEESFIDELAYLAKEDPYEFRLKHSRRAVATFQGDDYWRQMTERALRVFEEIPKRVDWYAPLPANHGRGVAISKFGSTIVAQVVEVAVEHGDFKVLKVDAFVAPGVVVNPQLAENQIEGAIVWALSALKYGKLTFENGRVKESNFHDYPVLRIDETPEMAVHFIKDDGPMGGIGEPGVPALAPAALNAIFAASGKRIRTLPIDRSELAI